MDKQLKNIDDAYKWSLETVESLRIGDFSRIDTDELINEIGSIASGLYRELVSVLREIIESMLVLEHTEANEIDKRDADLRLTHAQGQLQLILYASPSLKQVVAGAVKESYLDARSFVSEDYNVILPETCFIPLDRIVEDPYDRLVARRTI